MHRFMLTTVIGLSLCLSASANQNTETFKQMFQQRKANGNKVLQSVPKKVIQSKTGKLTPFQQQVEDMAQQLVQDGILTDAQQAYQKAEQQVKKIVVKVKDGYRSGEYLQKALCHKTDDGIGCLNDKALEGKRPSNAYLPGFFPSEMNYTTNVKEMINEARIAHEVQPWSDDYWAIARGILGNRYANYDFEDYSWDGGANYVLSQEGHLSKILNMPAGEEKDLAIDLLSPSEKYDLIIGTTDTLNYSWIQWTPALYENGDNLFGKIGGFLTPHQWYQGQGYFDRDGEVETWMGICHGWAAAAIQMERPKNAVQVLAADGKTKVNFYPAEIKALGSYLWAKSAPRSRFIGGRCNDKDVEYDELSGAIIDSACFDTNPKDWHTVVTNYIGKYKKSFVMDITFDYEVWNQPVLGYSVSFSNPMDENFETYESVEEAAVLYSEYKDQDIFRNIRNPSPQTKYIVNVNMEVEYLVENTPEQRGSDTYDNDEITETYYSYDLELDANFNIIGGEWHANEHPDFLWGFDADQKAISETEENSEYSYDSMKAVIDFNTPLHSELQKLGQEAARRGEILGSFVEALFEAAQ